MRLNEVLGWIGYSLLILAMLQTNLALLRIINIVATSVFLSQSIILRNKSLITTNITLILINLVMLWV